jgi:predicted Zn finger-like uncharacterized protein
MQVKCPSCGAVVPAADVNLDRMLAKCARCSSVFDIASQVGRTPGAPPAEGRARRLVPMPRNIRVVADEDEAGMPMYRDNAAGRPHIVLERRWFSGALFFMVFFCIFWDGFLVVWYANVFHHGVNKGSLVGALFPLIHVTAGVFLTYTTLCGFVNRTRIAVKDGVLSIWHGPLPWRGNRAIAVEDLAQLYCQEHVGNKGSRSYSLNALLKDGDKVRLIRSLSEPDQALYVEQVLEKRLGIVDVAVAGEYT